MATPGSGVVRLHRPLTARLVGGSRLHPVLTVLFLLDLVATIVAALAGAGSGAIALPISLAVLFLLSAFGFAAAASVEDAGIAWRYVARRAFSWKDVTALRFTSTPGSVLGGGTRPAIVVVVDRFSYGITPAYGVAPARLLPFAQGLAGFARTHDVEIRVEDERWRDLGVDATSRPQEPR